MQSVPQAVRLALIARKEDMKAMKKIGIGLTVLSFALSTSPGFADWDSEDFAELQEPSQAAIELLKKKDPDAEELMETSHSFIVLPSVKLGGFAITGAHGAGLLYEDGTPIALVKMRQLNLGAELGIATYSEVLFFESAEAFDRFIDDPVGYSARAEAMTDGDGATAKNKNYVDGVMVITLDHDGYLYGASLSGQKYHIYYRP